MTTMVEQVEEGVPDCEAWTGYRQMVLTPIISGGASSLAFILHVFSIKFSPEQFMYPSFYLAIAACWLITFIIAAPTTALFGIIAHGVFWHGGWRRPWHYVAGAFVFALVGGGIFSGLDNPIFYVISSGIIGLSGGLSFHWAAYRSRKSTTQPPKR
jgi:hypothetical protein